MAVWGWNDINKNDSVWAAAILEEESKTPIAKKQASLLQIGGVALFALCILAIAFYASVGIVRLPSSSPTIPSSVRGE